MEKLHPAFSQIANSATNETPLVPTPTTQGVDGVFTGFVAGSAVSPRIHNPSYCKRERGVTLIEVLIVVAIVAMVAGAASIGGLKAWEESVKKSAKIDAKAIRTAVKTWWLQGGEMSCPSIERLTTDGALDKDGRKTDPWGTAWKIECEEGDVSVKSSGRDKRWGTEDDISVPPKSSS